MKARNILYIAISVFCVIAIILGIYHYVFTKKTERKDLENMVDNYKSDPDPIENPKDALAEFEGLFTSTFNAQGFSTDNITKIEGLEANDIIYTLKDANTPADADGIIDEKEGQYEIDVKIPVINIAGDAVAQLNGKTQNLFVDKTASILNGEQTRYTVFNIEYASYLNDNILSIAIKASLKEGNNPQRVMVQTYNFDIVKNRTLTLNEILQDGGYDRRTVNKKIDEQIREASKQAETISQATQQIMYKRDINNSMYTTDNANNFLVGEDGQIYIIYAYGNNNSTSEMDVVKVDKPDAVLDDSDDI